MEPTPNITIKVAIVTAQQTSKAVAKRAKIPETRFSAIVNGRIVPSVAEQKRIARALNTTTDHLFAERVA